MADLTDDMLCIPERVMPAEAIAYSVARAIAAGFLKPGERVTEMALSDRIGVSLAPVREALKVLHAQGMVTADSSRGFRAAVFDDDTTQKVLEVRLSLEAILLRDAVRYWQTHDPAATVGEGGDKKELGVLGQHDCRQLFTTAARKERLTEYIINQMRGDADKKVQDGYDVGSTSHGDANKVGMDHPRGDATLEDQVTFWWVGQRKVPQIKLWVIGRWLHRASGCPGSGGR